MPPKLPSPKVDTHAHVFHRSLPMVADKRYEIAYDAPLQAYIERLDTHGLTHGVLVQPSFLGTDNSFMLQALRTAQGRLRGIAVIDPETPDNVLSSMAGNGVVGIRLNLIGKPVPNFALANWPIILDKIGVLGWQIEVHAHASDLPAVLAPLIDRNLKIVVDHFGRPDKEKGIDDPGFQFLLSLASSGLVWCKLSAGYRLGFRASRLPELAAKQLLDVFGAHRLVWGSDWPHTMHEQTENYDETVRAFESWIPNAKDRAQILGQTAADLFHLR